MLTVHRCKLYRCDLKTRFPFRYGIASMTEVPYLIVQAEITFAGNRSVGLSADLLPPKWFTKDPDSDYKTEDLPRMHQVIQHAAALSTEAGPQPSIFSWWSELYEQQTEWATAEQIAPLLANFGVSLIERAVLDAACRATDSTIHKFLRNNICDVDLAAVRPELRQITPADVVVKEPAKRLQVRHTIGMGDPLSDQDIATSEQVDDGLPHSLIANIRSYGLQYFKIKLSGNFEHDGHRLLEIATILNQEVAAGARFTMDGNENFKNIEEFRQQYESHLANPVLKSFFDQGLLFVEQPLHRDDALSESVRVMLDSWSTAPPIIIDESDAQLASLPQALSLGYAGTSHKNCKGVIKGLINAASIQAASAMRTKQSQPAAVLSGEDLANLGPVALLQDFTIAACFGIPHVERNGHHYFAGLSGFPQQIQEQVLRHHADLYHRSDSGITSVTVTGGHVCIESLLNAPFGYRELNDLTGLEEVA